ncbi:mycocerosic acid synthase-like [Varanus komodoensis]|uniref:mycocerosic acid synthase-like n=1 Tax=Varanus komodoensis TaxID=61221 RepID=UPI001CF7D02A|nr:mycocerosic acid synthase-like [Varanus komodoensis]
MMETKDEIAIVGIGCNFPGGEGIDNFWHVLIEGRNCAEEIPPERFDIKDWYDSDSSKPSKTGTRHAAFLKEFNTFDNRFFGINDMEAEHMDPQQKLLLECSYRALEDAGVTRENISGSKTAVFVGMMNRDYTQIASRNIGDINHYDGTGQAMSIAANRISYTFNLTGPSVAIDTACSSFHYALHFALHAIKQGDCEAALCGGVNCIIEPQAFINLSKAKMISPEGISKPFSKKADGYGRGEGCGVLLLKPLKKAQEEYNRIWGVITSCAVNQNGRSVTPITRPSQQQQENLLLGIYPALVDPSTVQYVEAHGTGTPAGDSTEAESIGNVIGKKRSPNLPPLKVGSIKGNIGHTESAAGAAGVIKVLLMMHHGKIVPSLHYSESNSSIDTEKLNLSIPTTVEKWDESHEYGRVAGINCFGFGGTNAHVVVRQAKQTELLPSVHRPVELFVISAASGNSLKLTGEDTARYLNTNNSVTLPNLAYTSACRRSHLNHKYRKAFVVSSLQHLEQQLPSTVETAKAPSSKTPQIIFVFPGNGLNLKGTFGTLLKSEPVFRDKCKEIEQLFQKYSYNSILELTEREHVDLSNPEIAHRCSITIITYRTTDRIVDHINPGFALYGMARACMLEATNITFQMIDISSTSAMDILALANVLVGYDAEIYPEVWINQGRIYTSEISSTQTNNILHNHKSQSLSNCDLFGLYTSEPNEAREISAELADSIDFPLDAHHVEVQIEKISIHSEDYFPVSVSSWNFGNTLYWNSQTIHKYKLLALDCSGTVVAAGSKVKQLRVGDHIASCYPVAASSRIRIPETVCFNTQKFPCFETVPCVSLFRIAWEILHEILSKIKRNGSLGIISTEPKSVLCKILSLSAQEAGWKTVCTILDSNLEQCVSHCNALVFLNPLEKLPRDVLAHLPYLHDVAVLCGNHHPEYMTSLLRNSHENFQIHALSLSSIFQKASLKISQKPFSKWMKSMQQKQFKDLPSSIFQQLENSESSDNAVSSTFTCKSIPLIALKNKHDSCISDIPLCDTKRKLFKQNAVYIVTGGLTGLGFETVKFIAQNGGGCIVILSRRKPNAEMQKEICNVQNQNKQSRIVSVQCNIIFKSDVESAIKSISKTFPKCPIKGIFHSAVVFHDASIEALSRATFEEVLSAKVAGALNLHHATQGLNLDYFVCYSSVSSFLGNAMQANYAAANSFLEHFCHYRRNCGLPGQSISWGALNLGVLQNQSGIQNLLESKGIAILQVDEIHEYLKTSLTLNNPQQVVVKLNIKSLITHYFSRSSAMRSRMRTVLAEFTGSNVEPSEKTVINDLAPIKAEDYVMSLVSELSGADLSDIAMNTRLLSLGIDSMLAMTIQNRIFQDKKTDVPLVKLLDPETTVLNLASFLEEASNRTQ